VPNNEFDVVIIGAGQAGLAVSYYLSRSRINHVIFEQGVIANAWRNERWDSFCLVTPNWSINLPGAVYEGDNPHGFMKRDEFVNYMEEWSKKFDAPVREGIKVTKVRKIQDHFLIETDQGSFSAIQVIVATATYQQPHVPCIFKKLDPKIDLLTAVEYRNPSKISEGGILVVGSGQSGCQIAEELNRSGRRTFLSVGHTGRLPRRYRGADCIQWQLEMGWLDRTPDLLAYPELRFRGDPHLSGSDGGRTLSLHQLRREGVRLLGRVETIKGGVLKIKKDLKSAVDASDKYAEEFRQTVDEYIKTLGLAAPQAKPDEMLGEPMVGDEDLKIIAELDLSSNGISTVILATGFEFDFSWLKFSVFDQVGYPITNRGATSVPGLYFMGLNWMNKRKSGIIFGVAEDAKYIESKVKKYNKRSRSS